MNRAGIIYRLRGGGMVVVFKLGEATLLGTYVGLLPPQGSKRGQGGGDFV